MVDVDQRMSGLNPAHVAGLRRLSARAAAPSPTASLPIRNGVLSFTSLADKLISHLRNSGISVQTGLSDTEFSRAVLSGGRTPRWVEFWTDAAVNRRRRNSSASASFSPERVFKSEIPKWVDRYVGEIGSVLREGGWCESDIAEIVGVSGSGFFEPDMVLWDNQAVLDALLLKTDRLSDSLRKAGWSSEEVSEALGFESRRQQERKPAVKLSPELVERIEKLAESGVSVVKYRRR